MLLATLAGKPAAGHKSAPPDNRHGSCLFKNTCSPSSNRAKLKVALPGTVLRRLAWKDSEELSGLKDTSKVVSLVCSNPGHADGGPEELNVGSALVYARDSDHDRDSKESFILGQSMVGDVVMGCGQITIVLLHERNVDVNVLEETGCGVYKSRLLLILL